jgi:hypothetical protein
MEMVANLYKRVHGVHLWEGRTASVFPSDWVARKLGMAKLTAWIAIDRLRAAEWFVVTDTMPVRKGRRPAFLYVPGLPVEEPPATLPAVTASVEADVLGLAVDQRQELGEDVPVHKAIAGDGGEVLEDDDRPFATGGRADVSGGGVGHAANCATNPFWKSDDN